MLLNDKIKNELFSQGADFAHFVDISHFPESQNKGFRTAILIGIALSPGFIQKVTDIPDYVKRMKENNTIDEDEFHNTEKKSDKLADYLAGYLINKGYSAYSQSEDNLYNTGFYDGKIQCTPLPHKTIALCAGVGWIGKHNLLVTDEFGSAVSICTVLTDAPVETVCYEPKESFCGDCQVCVETCPTDAIKGNNWHAGITRVMMLDVAACNPCLRCLALCPWTQKYMNRNFDKAVHI